MVLLVRVMLLPAPDTNRSSASRPLVVTLTPLPLILPPFKAKKPWESAPNVITLVLVAVTFPPFVPDKPKAPAPRVVMVPPLNSIRPPLSASAPDAAAPSVLTLRFVPNILPLASNQCTPFQLAPLVLIVEFCRLMIPSCATAPSASNPVSDDKIPVVVIEIPLPITVPPFE